MARGMYIGVEPEIKQLSEMTIGNSVKLNVGGSPTEFLVVHQGLPSSAYDTSCDGIWLVMKDCYELMKWHTSTSNSYKASSVHTYLNGTFLSKLDTDVQSLIKQVKIPYVNGTGSSGSVASGSSGLSTKVFLLSAKEVGTSNSAASTEGAKLSYFTSNSRRIAKLNGSAQHYWLRSVCINNTKEACCIYDTGELNPTDQVTNTYATIRPALILPLETTIVDGVVKGTQEPKSVARKVKQMYVGVSDKARRVKKGYIGIGGVARPFWGDYKLGYYGTVTAMTFSEWWVCGGSIGDYALFAGGQNAYPATVNAYNSSLVRKTPTALSVGRGSIASTTIGDYLLFAGGTKKGGESNVVDAYNKSLTRKTATALYDTEYQASATTVGNYAIIAGNSAYASAYDASLTKTSIEQINTPTSMVASTTVGDYAIFGGGGASSGISKTTTAYNSSLTKSTPTTLSYSATLIGATTVGNYAIFGGGCSTYISNVGYTTVNAYNSSLVRSIPSKLSKARGGMGAVTVNGYGLFAGGTYGDVTVDTYNESLTKGVATNLSSGRDRLGAATVGNYALFAGGYSYNSNSTTNVVEAYVAE